MKRYLAAFLCLIALCQAATFADVPGFVEAKGHSLCTADGHPIHLRGVSLGNWLVPEGYMFGFEHAVSSRQIHDGIAELVGPDEARAFWRKWTEGYVTRDDVRFIARAGYNCIRVPFNSKLFMSEEHPEIWFADGFTPLDRLVGWAREAGLWVVLDMHVAPGGQTGANIDDSYANAWIFESPESQARMVELWKRIAAHYRNEPTVLGYELLNEPIADYTNVKRYNPMLEPLYRRATAAIREVDPRHLVILGGAQWDSNFAVFGPPFDPHLVYTFHSYWGKTDATATQQYVDFRSKYNVPIWLGESGENTDEWVAAFRTTLEHEDIDWCFWPYKKINATSCPVSIPTPRYWAEVVRYVDALNQGDYEDRCRKRPPLRHCREALQSLLENMQLARCKVNEGYLKALGLTPAAR